MSDHDIRAVDRDSRDGVEGERRPRIAAPHESTAIAHENHDLASGVKAARSRTRSVDGARRQHDRLRVGEIDETRPREQVGIRLPELALGESPQILRGARRTHGNDDTGLTVGERIEAGHLADAAIERSDIRPGGTGIRRPLDHRRDARPRTLALARSPAGGHARARGRAPPCAPARREEPLGRQIDRRARRRTRRRRRRSRTGRRSRARRGSRTRRRVAPGRGGRLRRLRTETESRNGSCRPHGAARPRVLYRRQREGADDSRDQDDR